MMMITAYIDCMTCTCHLLCCIYGRLDEVRRLLIYQVLPLSLLKLVDVCATEQKADNPELTVAVHHSNNIIL